MADNTVWLTIASVLATLNLSKQKDKDGNEIEVTGEFTNGFLRCATFCSSLSQNSFIPYFISRHPKPYQSCITTRGPYVEKLVRAATASK